MRSYFIFLEGVSIILISPYTVITTGASRQLVQYCANNLPIEACGLLASSHQQAQSDANDQCDGICASTEHPPVINSIIPIRNIHSNPHNAFMFDPHEWVAAYYSMQKNRQTFVGYFHSHPYSDAIPSTLDHKGLVSDGTSIANMSDASNISDTSAFTPQYWIISLNDCKSPQMQPYVLKDGKFERIRLVLA